MDFLLFLFEHSKATGGKKRHETQKNVPEFRGLFFFGLTATCVSPWWFLTECSLQAGSSAPDPPGGQRGSVQPVQRAHDSRPVGGAHGLAACRGELQHLLGPAEDGHRQRPLRVGKGTHVRFYFYTAKYINRIERKVLDQIECNQGGSL